jgi:hypothetical protein
MHSGREAFRKLDTTGPIRRHNFPESPHIRPISADYGGEAHEHDQRCIKSTLRMSDLLFDSQSQIAEARSQTREVIIRNRKPQLGGFSQAIHHQAFRNVKGALTGSTSDLDTVFTLPLPLGTTTLEFVMAGRLVAMGLGWQWSDTILPSIAINNKRANRLSMLDSTKRKAGFAIRASLPPE